MGGPPSFNGRLVRYIYKLAVGAQKPNCPTQITRLPVWVVTVPSKPFFATSLQLVNPSPPPEHLQSPCVSTPSVSNPFIVGREKQSTSVNGLEAVAAEASRRTSCELASSSSLLYSSLIFYLPPSLSIHDLDDLRRGAWADPVVSCSLSAGG